MKKTKKQRSDLREDLTNVKKTKILAERPKSEESEDLSAKSEESEDAPSIKAPNYNHPSTMLQQSLF